MKQIRDITKIYWFFIYVTIVPFIFATFFEKQREEDFVFIFINAAILLFSLYIKKLRKIIFSLVFVSIFIPAFLDFGHIFLYQGRITQSTFFIIFDSNIVESKEFIDSNFSYQLILSCIAYIISSCFFFLKSFKYLETSQFKWKWHKFFALFVLLPFVIKLLSAGYEKTVEAYTRSSHLVSLVKHFNSYKEEMNHFANFGSKIKTDYIIENKSILESETHILVIGESTTKNKMSLYGYERETTPELEKLRDELYVFSDVVSSHVGTLANLKRILTLGNKDDDSAEKLRSNIISIMKNAGYKTYWLSNQLILGKHDTITSVFAKQADKSFFTNTTNSVTYDEKLLPILKNVLMEKDTKKKFIVVHLIGTHMKYRNRFPKKYIKFDSSEGITKRDFHNQKKIQFINDYDNSVFYHDWVLSELLNIVKSESSSMTLTYLSDHGEEVYDLKNLHGHPSVSETRNMYEIPFFIWSSDKYKDTYNANFSKYVDRKYITDELIHTIFDLTKVYPVEFDSTGSVINENFVFRDRPMGL